MIGSFWAHGYITEKSADFGFLGTKRADFGHVRYNYSTVLIYDSI